MAIEEIVDGVPYARVWFYWRYEDDADEDGFVDGWRHVPPDYTFWGNLKTYAKENVTVNYREVDVDLARLVGDRLHDWMNVACTAINCEGIPTIQIEISPTMINQIDWSPDESWLLQMRSPYASRARSDLPFAPELQIQTAGLLAEKLVLHAMDDIPAAYPSDAYYLQQAVISWLVGRFVLIDTNSFLISSLATNYGEQTVGVLLQAMQPDSDASIISQVTGEPLDQSQLDWRDFFTWRLALEADLIIRQDAENFLSLYDRRDEAVLNIASERFNQVTLADTRIVTLVQTAEPAIDGSSQRLVTARAENVAEEQIMYRLVDGNWVRAN